MSTPSTTARTDSDPARIPGMRPRRGGRIVGVLASRGLALFAETIVVSLAVAVLSTLAVTALPALAAGSAHLRRHVEGETDSLLELGRDFLRALRGGWGWGILTAAVYAAAAVTVTSPMIEVMPGGDVYRWLSGILALAIAVVLLRAASAWHPSAKWGVLLRTAATRAASDVTGSLLLILAIGLASLIVWMFAPLVVLVPGMLVLAARAVASRPR